MRAGHAPERGMPGSGDNAPGCRHGAGLFRRGGPCRDRENGKRRIERSVGGTRRFVFATARPRRRASLCHGRRPCAVSRDGRLPRSMRRSRRRRRARAAARVFILARPGRLLSSVAPFRKRCPCATAALLQIFPLGAEWHGRMEVGALLSCNREIQCWILSRKPGCQGREALCLNSRKVRNIFHNRKAHAFCSRKCGKAIALRTSRRIIFFSADRGE